ncbi:MAG TPA: hypothetical protein PJ984_00690 [Candidatus Saccharibacteria bacterium]|nr:hypothetical protein [Candidatus Saccharibacteria bacterium]
MNNEASPTPTNSNLEGRPLDQAEVFAIKRAAREEFRPDSTLDDSENSQVELPAGPLQWKGEIPDIEDADKVAKRVAKAVVAGLTREDYTPSTPSTDVGYQNGPEGSYVGVDSDGEVVDMIFPDEWEH